MPHANLEERIAYQKQYRLVNRKLLLEAKRSYWKNQRLHVLLHYSNGTLQCACCGETEYKFMSLDHIHGHGNTQRRQLKTNYLLSWLIKNSFPEGYQVLCHNCNLAKGFYGQCPHRSQKCENHDTIV